MMNYRYAILFVLLLGLVLPVAAQNDGSSERLMPHVPWLDSLGRPQHIHAGDDLFEGTGLFTSVPDDEYWDNQFAIPAADGDIHALVSSGDTVFVGGAFMHMGKNPFTHICYWDAANWREMGSGIDGTVYAIAVHGNDVFVGGEFSNAGGVPARNIARWDRATGTWHALGQGISGTDYATVSVLAIKGDSVYVGGHFRRAGSVDVRSLACWNRTTSAWSAIGAAGEPDGVDGEVLALGVVGHQLYVGGSFSKAGAIDAGNIAFWDDSSRVWGTFRYNQPGTGVNGYVNAIVATRTNLYLAGNFKSVFFNPSLSPPDTSRVENFIAWEGLSGPPGLRRWNVAGYVSGTVRVMTTGPAGGLYLGGAFRATGPDGTELGQQPSLFTSYVATTESKYGGFSPLGFGSSNGVDGYVNAIAIAGRNVYVGGMFRRGGRDVGGRILRYNLDDKAWSPLYTGPNGTIFALGTRDTSIWAGGTFTTSDGRTAYHIARWDGLKWNVIKPTVDGPLYAMSIDGEDIYVGGEFQVVGSQSAVNVARYNIPTTTWHSLGDATGVGGGRISYAFAIAARGNDVYAGGEFTIADDALANNIAHWDRATGRWSPLGEGVNGAVRAIAIADNGDIYAGGDFTVAGGVVANHVARWDGTQWHALGAGTNDIIWIVTLNGDELFVGGDFTKAGGDSSRNIARWDTKSERWLSVGGGVTGGFAPLINAIVPAGGRVYAAGYFSHMGGVETSAIAKWDGTSWSPLGSGLNNVVRAMVANDDGLFVAGDFTTAGGKFSHHVGRWMKPLNSIIAGSGGTSAPEQGVAGLRPNPVHDATTLHFSVPERSRVQIRVFDLLGSEVASLCDSELTAGEHELVWNTEGLGSGTYLCRISCGGTVSVACAVIVQR